VIEKMKIKKVAKPAINRPVWGDFFNDQSACLSLQDGKKFNGFAPIWQTGEYSGEVVFNTGNCGYIESLTDPSYAGQILVFTYPLIGNYGVDLSQAESGQIQVSGVVVNQAVETWNHAGSDRSLLEWLKQNQVPIIYGVDTRALTKHLRLHGTMVGIISNKSVNASKINLKTQFRSIQKPTRFNFTNNKKIILVDCGSKANIRNMLENLKLNVRLVPFDYDYSQEDYDGVVLSNGPGNPTDYESTIKIAAKAMKNGRPVMGICLGTQIMALAAGAKTYKLRFGHRGHNQPCREENTGKCFITSQNHGYAIDDSSLPSGWQVMFRNLNDGSVEGITHKQKPFFSVQFHPESSPGPTDTRWLFNKFEAMV
jgi:carbamoyl-phosphate synthase small subunit